MIDTDKARDFAHYVQGLAYDLEAGGQANTAEDIQELVGITYDLLREVDRLRREVSDANWKNAELMYGTNSKSKRNLDN